MAKVAEGRSNILSGSKEPIYNIENPGESSKRVRIKMKEGVTSFYNPFNSWTSYIDVGLQDAPGDISLENQPCGEYITLVLYPNSRVGGFNSAFFSQIEILYDPLPYFVFLTSQGDSSGNVKIESPNFEAPDGITDNEKLIPTFSGSTFKKAPRIYSDDAMSRMTKFPPRDFVSESRLDAYTPFAGCPNVEEIEYQGDLSAEVTKILTRCNFEQLDRYGRSKTDAWPKISGEFNGNIFGYVSASYPTMSDCPILFESFGPDCKNIYKPWDCEALLIDYSGSYSLPLWGFSFEKCEDMERLVFQDTQFMLDIDLDGDNVRNSIKDGTNIEEKNELLNLQFSLSALGIQAPKKCKQVENLHNLFAVFFSPIREKPETRGVDVKMHHVTPSSLKSSIYAWGASLEDLWGSSNFEKDENDVPLIPNGMQFLGGYYHKVLCGLPYSFYTPERVPRPYAQFQKYDTVSFAGDYLGDWNLKSLSNGGNKYQFRRYCRDVVKDGNAFQLSPPSLAGKLVDGAGLRCYVKNLYAHNVIRQDINIPPILEQVVSHSQSFAGMLAFSQGIKRANMRSLDTYKYAYFWNIARDQDYMYSSYYDYIHGSKTMNSELRGLLDNSVANSFKIRQTSGITTEQRAQFGEGVQKIEDNPMGKTRDSFLSILRGDSGMRGDDSRFFGVPNIIQMAYDKGYQVGLDARKLDIDYKAGNSSLWGEVKNDVGNAIFGKNEALDTVYDDYPRTVPDSVLEHSFSTSQQFEEFIKNFAENGNQATYEHFLIGASISIGGTAINATHEYYTQYRFAFMSELDLGREDIGNAIISKMASVERVKVMVDSFYTIPPFIQQGSPLIVFETYIERDYVPDYNFIQDSDKRDAYILLHGGKDNARIRMGSKIVVPMLKNLLDRDSVLDLRFDATNLVNALPEFVEASGGTSSTGTGLFNPSVFKTKSSEISSMVQGRGYSSEIASAMIGNSYTLGNDRTSPVVGYNVGKVEKKPLRTIGSTLPNMQTRNFNFGNYDTVTDSSFIIFANRNYTTINLDDSKWYNLNTPQTSW